MYVRSSQRIMNEREMAYLETYMSQDLISQEKKELFVQLKRKEAEMDTLSVEVVNELKAQLKGEKARLERERHNAEILGLRQD